MLATVEASTVRKIHEYLAASFADTEDPISPPGIRSEGLLDSAVSRQHTGFNGQLKYPLPLSNAASLIFGICNNHPFHNGNKRTALLAGILHLDLNGYVLHRASNDQLYDVMLKVASHKPINSAQLPKIKRRGQDRTDAEVSELEQWLHDKSRRVQMGERSITFGRLYQILEAFEFKIGYKRNNRAEILKRTRTLGILHWKCVYKVSCPGDSRTVSLNEIKQVREALKLTEPYGVDSITFYGEQTLIDGHVSNYRNVLRRLAKT